MRIISLFYQILLEALFPQSPAEQAVLSMSPQEAWEKLPPAPGYAGLAVELPGARSVFAYKDERVAKLVWSIKYKKSTVATRIGGYALWKMLMTTAGSGGRVLRDTPSSPAGDAAGSRSRILESTDSPSLAPKRPKNSLSVPVILVSIPITKKRRRERGYNQCELLIDEIARLDTEKIFLIEKNLLVRTQHLSRQTLKGREERVESAKGIFAINEEVLVDRTKNELGTKLMSANIILIDDVITTGSTVHAALEILKEAGFSDVQIISLAH